MKMSLIAHVVTMKYLRHFQNTSTVTSLFPVISQKTWISTITTPHTQKKGGGGGEIEQAPVVNF